MAWWFWPVLAVAAIVTAEQVANAIRHSPHADAFLKAHAAEIGALAINVESGGDTEAYNGSCCYGVLQLNTTNILASGYSVSEYRHASLQEQVDAWSKIQSKALGDPVIAELNAMETFDGQPVDAPLLLACVQLGQGNCKTMVQSGQCSGFSDANGTTICKVAAGMRSALNGLPAGGGVTAGSGGDVGTGSVAVNGGGAHVPASASTGTAPHGAFGQASGLSTTQAAAAIKLMAGGLMLLWLAWAAKASWSRFTTGSADVRDMTASMMRAAGVATVAMLLLS